MAHVRTVPLDVTDDGDETYPDHLARVAPTLTATLDDESGPGGGWPTYVVEGEHADVLAYLRDHYAPGNSDQECADYLDTGTPDGQAVTFG